MCNLKPFVLPGLLLFACGLYAQSPGGISRQSVWMKGGLSQETVLPPTLNFHPGISETDGKLPRNVQSLRRVTIFTVYQSPTTADEAPVWEMKGGFGDLALSTTQVSSQSANTNLLFMKNKPARTEALIHTFFGKIQQSSISEKAGIARNVLRLGNLTTKDEKAASSPLISEFILYEKILKEGEIVKVESYLALKYGITLQRNYINSSNDVVWNYKIDSAWSNNIAGIARDDRATLYQKQSTSSNLPGKLVIGIDKIETLNSRNTGQLDDRNYLIWGDNAGNLTFKEDPAACDGQMLLPPRKWLMKRTGNNADKITTELQIDVKAILGEGFQKTNFYLVIDRTGTGQFANENCIYFKPSSISTEGIASFKGLHWDTDGSGKDVFTFGIKAATPIVKEAPGLVSFQVYPNPVTGGNYKMALTLDKISDIEIRVYDMHQRLVQSTKGVGQISYLFPGRITGAAGAYTVKVITPQAEYSRIIIVQ